MKSNYIPLFILAMIAFACKKETKNITADQSPISVNAPVSCSGDTWDPATAYFGLPEVPYFVYNDKAYFINLGPVSASQNTMRIYDGSTWQSYPIIATPFTFAAITQMITFVIGDKGYFCFVGSLGLFEYNFANHTWTSKKTFQGLSRVGASSFVIGNKAYIVGGRSQTSIPTNFNDCWEYDPAADDWKQKASFEYIGRCNASGFSVGNKGYIANGVAMFPNNFGVYLHELLEYNPATDSWSAKTPFPGTERSFSQAFVINGKAYVGGGSQWPLKFQDFYRYTQSSNTWARIQDIPVLDKLLTGFALGNNGYILWNSSPNDRFDKYTPKVCAPVSSGGISIALSN
jgi:N-acetylneuraminic acid mutarotase